MAHTYDLVLQAATPGAPPPLEALITALQGRGATLSAEGNGTWKLAAGEVTVSVLIGEGAKQGLDVRVPMRDSTALVEEAATALVELAETTEARVTDPQRGAEVTLTNVAALVDEYLRMARYAGEYGGDGGALGLTSYAQPLETTSGTARWLTVATVFVLALWFTWRAVTSTHRDVAPDEPPAEVNRPPKIPGK